MYTDRWIRRVSVIAAGAKWLQGGQAREGGGVVANHQGLSNTEQMMQEGKPQKYSSV